MNTLLKISFFIITISLFNCKTTKKSDNQKENTITNNQKTSQVIIKNEEMKEKGFSKGIITASKNNACPYILTIEEYTDKLDPINLQDFFKSDVPKKVWVKQNSLRMMNRCDEARPISIVEIIKRED